MFYIQHLTIKIILFVANDGLLTPRGRLYAMSVRQASALPAASFRLNHAVDTLAIRLTVPPVRPVRDLTLGPCLETHPQVNTPCRAHHKKAPALQRRLKI